MLRYEAVFSRGQGADGGGGVCCWIRWSRSFREIGYWTMSVMSNYLLTGLKDAEV